MPPGLGPAATHPTRTDAALRAPNPLRRLRRGVQGARCDDGHGGHSVAIVSSRPVTIRAGSNLTTSNGGRGAPAGVGANGSAGTDGTACPAEADTAGGRGGRGGNGGMGSPGFGGAGGSSAIVLVPGDTPVTIAADSEVTVGTPGAAAESMPPYAGEAATVVRTTTRW